MLSNVVAGNAGHSVGLCGREGNRADSNGAAVQPDHKWTGVLCGGSPGLHICITDTHHEQGVH